MRGDLALYFALFTLEIWVVVRYVFCQVPKTYFKQNAALSFLVQRAKELEIGGSDVTLKNPVDLVRANLIPWSESIADRVLRGDRTHPISGVHADKLRARFKISPEDWARITDQVLDAAEEEKLRQQISPLLGAIALRGLASVLTLRPAQLSDNDLEQFCVPARVVTDEEWQSILGTPLGDPESPDSTNLARISRRASGVLLNTWLGREHQHVVLYGEPGEGKTTAIWLHVANRYHELRNVKHAPDPDVDFERIPLVLPLKRIEAGETRGLVTLAIKHAFDLIGTGMPHREQFEEWFRYRFRMGDLLLILDGFDELSPNAYEWLRREIEGLGSNSILLTTRYHADPSRVLRSFRSLRMVPLRWWIVDEHVHRYFQRHPQGTALANRLRSQLRSVPSLRQLSQNPLLLAALCARAERSQVPWSPHSRAEVLTDALRVLMEREDERRGFLRARILRNEDKIKMLSHLAWNSYSVGPVPMSEVEVSLLLNVVLPQFENDPPPTAEALLDELIADGILVRQGSGPYTFLLRRFHELCLAHCIAGQLRALPDEEAQRLISSRSEAWNRTPEWPDFRPLNHPSWTEIWPLLAGSMGSSKTLIEAATAEWRHREDKVDSRLRLLIGVLGEYLAANRRHPGIVEQHRDLTNEVVQALMNRVAGAVLIPGLPGSWITMAASLPPELTVPSIIDRLRRSPSERQASAYVLALGEIGTDDARQHLEMLLRNGAVGDDVHDQVTIALGLVGDTASRDILLEMIQQKPRKTLLLGCICGIASIADRTSREALASILQSDKRDADVVLDSLRHCETLFGPEIEKNLVQLALVEAKKLGKKLPGRDVGNADDLIQECARVLGRIGRPESATSLRVLLDYPLSDNTRRQVLQSIAEIGNVEDREFLRGLLKNSQHVELAAIALVGVADESMLLDLLAVASEGRCPEPMRESVTEAAGFSRSERALNFLVARLLQDPSPRVQKAAAISLGAWGGPKALEVLRLALKKHDVDYVGMECARSLAIYGDPTAIQILLRILTDNSQQPTLRIPAIHAIAQCDSGDAREALFQLAFDPKAPLPLRVRSLDALGTIQRRQGWRPLCRGGWDRP